MDLISILLVIAVVGLLVYLVTTYIPMPPPFPNIIIAVAVIVIVVWVLQRFALLPANVLPR